MPRVRALPLVFGVTVTAHLLGCFTLVDVDRYKRATAEGSSSLPTDSNKTPGPSVARSHFDLHFTMANMKPHSGHLLEYSVIDANNFIQSRGVVLAMTNGDTTLTVPRAIPQKNGPHRLDYYADVNHSGGYDGIGSVLTNDHAWRIDPLVDFPEGAVTPIEGVVQVNFVHDTSFTDINQYPSGTPNPPKDTGLSAKIRLTGLDAAVGKLVQVRLADRASGHVVGLFRHTALDAPTLEGVIKGCVDVGTDYDADIYVDANGNGVYDNPAAGRGDLGLRASATSTEEGLELTVDVAAHADKGQDVGPP